MRQHAIAFALSTTLLTALISLTTATPFFPVLFFASALSLIGIALYHAEPLARMHHPIVAVVRRPSAIVIAEPTVQHRRVTPIVHLGASKMIDFNLPTTHPQKHDQVSPNPPSKDATSVLHPYEQTRPFYFIRERMDTDKIKYHLRDTEDRVVSFDDMLNLLQQNEQVRSDFVDILKNCPFNAYFWECPPINSQNLASQQFEFVFINSRELAKQSADPSSFADYFKSGKEVVHFENMNKDAMLVVPTPLAEEKMLAQSLASFSRSAPIEKQHQFWQHVAKQTQKRISQHGSKNIWLSTSGLGVPWLHARLDSTPKYFRHADYKNVEIKPKNRIK